MEMAERLTAPTKYRVASTQCNSKPAHPTSNATLFKFFLGHKLLTSLLSLFSSVLLWHWSRIVADAFNFSMQIVENAISLQVARCQLQVASCALHFARSCGTNKNSTQNFFTVALPGILSTETAKCDKWQRGWSAC